METGILESRVAFGERLARAQAACFARCFGRVESQWKRDGSRVTEADLAISRALETALAEAFPDDLFLSEEREEAAGSIDVTQREYAWLADPIDGTNNFARGIPSCAVSLALLRHGEPVYGYVYDHGLQLLLQGGPGRGCRVGERRVDPGKVDFNLQSFIGAQTADGEAAACELDRLQRLCKVRALGSSALHVAYAAAGLLDAAVEWAIKPWDVAAGFAMIKGTGRVIRYMGRPAFPLRTFDTRAPAFGYLAGDPGVVEAAAAAIARAGR